jgi:Ala-tRNA(Pro) deacylase
MTMSITLEEFLSQHNAIYDLIPHPHTGSSMETAQEAHVPGMRLAKAVVMRDDGRYLMVVVPSAEHVDMALLRKQFGHDISLATETELADLFPDCETGAVPPLGSAWGVDTYVDESLLTGYEVYFESGDHESVVRVSADQFERLMENAERGYFGRLTQDKLG